MALPHVDEIPGTDRVSEDDLKILPDLAGRDGRYRFKLSCV